MKEFPLIVCYYTKDTFYQLDVQNLIASCEKWGLDYHVEPIASFGTWDGNCCYKPFFLLEKLEQFKRPLFWVDADAEFVQKPQWLEIFEKDIAVRINGDREDTHRSKVNSGSIFVNATEGAARILKAWGQECINSFKEPERKEEVWDQATLRDVIFRGVPGAETGALPQGYCAIAGSPCGSGEKGEVVVLHYLASRRNKKFINSQES